MNVRTKHISQLIRQYISEVEPLSEVILYGSRARGDERKDSDWDILVLLEQDDNIQTERKLRNKIYDLEIETGESFSVFVYSKKNWNTKQRVTPFFRNVSREGLIL